MRIQFFNQENWLAFWKDTIIRLDPAGSFKLAFPFDYAQEVSLSHGYKTMRCYLEPGDSLSFRTDANAFYQKMTFTGTATGPQQFLLDYFHEMRGDTFFHSYDHQLLEQDQLLKEFAELLEESHFFRVHQSHLVNIDCIQKYSKRDGGLLVMTDKAQIPVARARKEELLARLMARGS